MAGRFSIEAIFKGVDRLSGPARRIQRSMDRAMRGAASAAKLADRAMVGAAHAAQKMAIAVGAAAVAGGAALKNVVDVGADFEKTMVAAAAKFSPEIVAGTAEFKKLGAAAEAVGATTEFNAQQAAVALKDLASAGFGVDQAIGAIPGIVNLATAEQMDLAEASNIVTKSLGAFGLASDNAAVQSANLVRITDAMGKAAGVSKTGMAELFEAVKEGGPIATGAGIAMEEFLAIAAGLAESGIEASVAGTTLKNMIATISAPTKEASAVFRELGVGLRDSSGALRSPIAVLDELNKSIGTSPRRIELLEKAFGKIPLAGVVGLLGTGTAKLEQFHAAIRDSAGTTERLAGVMRNTTAGDIDGFSSAIDGVKIAIFGVIKGPLRGMLQGITAWVSANRELIATKFEAFLAKVGTVAKAVAPLLRRFFEGFAGKMDLPGTLEGISDGFDSLLAKIQTPEFEGMAQRWGERLGVVADAAVKIGGAIVSILPSVALLSDALQRPTDKIRELLAGGLGAGVGGIFAAIGAAAGGLRTAVEFVLALPGRALSAARQAMASIAATFERLKEAARPALEFIVGAAVITARGLRTIWAPVGAFFGALWSGVTTTTSVAWGAIAGIASAVYGRVLEVWQPIGAWFGALWQSVVTVTAPIVATIAGIAASAYAVFTGVWSSITGFFAGIWQAVADTFNAVLGALISRIEHVVALVRSVGAAELGGAGEPGAIPPGEGTVLVPPTQQSVDVSGAIAINDNSGRATVERQPRGPVRLNLQPSGAF